MQFSAAALYLPLLVALLSVPDAHSARFDNNSVWREADGLEIKAQGGCILEDGNVFHWFGPAFEGEDSHFHVINRYTSADLQNWKKQSPILTPDMPGLSAVPISSTSWVGRPWVMKRATGDYVMWIEAGKPAGGAYRNRFAVFSASGLSGPWVFDTVYASLPDSAGTQQSLGDLGAYPMYPRGRPICCIPWIKSRPTGIRPS